MAADRIAAYWPLGSELDTRLFLYAALERQKSVYLPVVRGESMWFSRWRGETPARDRSTGLTQPRLSADRMLNRAFLDLVLVPLVAFDRFGGRLGQGGGYYDRYFQLHREKRWRRPSLIGVAYDFQEVAQVPSDRWDVALDGIVTNDEFIIASSNTGSHK